MFKSMFRRLRLNRVNSKLCFLFWKTLGEEIACQVVGRHLTPEPSELYHVSDPILHAGQPIDAKEAPNWPRRPGMHQLAAQSCRMCAAAAPGQLQAARRMMMMFTVQGLLLTLDCYVASFLLQALAR